MSDPLHTVRRARLATVPPKSLHTTPPLSRQDIKTGKMTPQSYSCADISSALVEHLGRSEEELTTRQRRAMRKYTKYGQFNIGEPHNFKDLKKIFHIFNDLFFNGILKGHCYMHIVERCAESKAQPVGAEMTPTNLVLKMRRWMFWGEAKPILRFSKINLQLTFASLNYVAGDTLDATKSV